MGRSDSKRGLISRQAGAPLKLTPTEGVKFKSSLEDNNIKNNEKKKARVDLRCSMRWRWIRGIVAS